ncbi:MAG: enoyl-CoA hydratase [Pseudomonadales bacterium]|nr:enoyl-CoA hydratase [Pseudomonadales bacterium]
MSNVVLSEVKGRVGLITFNRPDALNAVNTEVMQQLISIAQDFDKNENIGSIVITGNEKAFVAGADIKEMQDKSYMDMFTADNLASWDRFTAIRTPMIAAVSGFALGGGCEIAMMCDIIFAADNAKFGQPEIKLGIIPGWGGTQRLVNAIGKAKAMDMILTGRMMNAEEAERSGLVARVFNSEKFLDEVLKVAEQIAGFSKPSTQVAKEAINRAFETSLGEGVLFERRTFYALFATEDQKEGMQAFTEKRPANFKHR